VRAITNGGPWPDQPGIVWVDLAATRLFEVRLHDHDGIVPAAAARPSTPRTRAFRHPKHDPVEIHTSNDRLEPP
jgi:hypothetical protein